MGSTRILCAQRKVGRRGEDLGVFVQFHVLQARRYIRITGIKLVPLVSTKMPNLNYSPTSLAVNNEQA